MKFSEDRSSESDAEGTDQLPQDGTLRRVAVQMQGLLEDFRTWIDLRIDLAILKVEERIDELRNEIALGLTLAISGFFAAIFSLATIALGVGWLLGHPFWGFLAVSVALILIVVILRATQPALVPPLNLLERLRGRFDDEQRGTDGANETEGQTSTPNPGTTARDSTGE